MAINSAMSARLTKRAGYRILQPLQRRQPHFRPRRLVLRHGAQPDLPVAALSRSDGFASSTVNYLGEDGLALGTYTLFDALDNSLGNRVFLLHRR